MAENYALQVLRSGVDYSDYKVALGALEGKLKGETLKDGELASASYKATVGSGEGATVVTRTLLGIKRTANGSNVVGGASVFIDVEETKSEIEAAIAKLLGTGSGDDDGLTLKSLDTAIKAEKTRAEAAEKENADAIDALTEKVDAIAITAGEGIVVDENDKLKVGVAVDGTSIIVGEDKKLKVVDSALTQYNGTDAIEFVDNENDNNKTIKLKIDTANKILSQGVNGLKATLSISYNDTTKEVELKAGSGDDIEIISSFDATKFIADGMLDEVAFSKETGKENYLVFTFNADGKKTPIEVNLAKFITTYTAGNGISLGEDERTISVDIKSGDNYIEIEDGKIASKGIDEKIAEEIGKLDAEVSSATGSKVQVTVKEVDGKVTEVAVTTNDIASADDLSKEITRATEAEEANADAIDALTEKVDGNTATIATNADAIDALTEKVDAMSLSKTGGDGKYIKSVTQTDGKVTVEMEDLKADKVASDAVTITVDGAGSKTVLESGTVQEALAAIATRLTAVEDNRVIDCGTW